MESKQKFNEAVAALIDEGVQLDANSRAHVVRHAAESSESMAELFNILDPCIDVGLLSFDDAASFNS
eukprot:5202711-Amphidinium_carterae.1